MLIGGPHQRSCKSPGLCRGARIKAAPWAAGGPGAGQGRGARAGVTPCSHQCRVIPGDPSGLGRAPRIPLGWGEPRAPFLMQFCSKTWEGFWGALPPPAPVPDLSHQDTNGSGHFIPGQNAIGSVLGICGETNPSSPGCLHPPRTHRRRPSSNQHTLPPKRSLSQPQPG